MLAPMKITKRSNGDWTCSAGETGAILAASACVIRYYDDIDASDPLLLEVAGSVWRTNDIHCAAAAEGFLAVSRLDHPLAERAVKRLESEAA